MVLILLTGRQPESLDPKSQSKQLYESFGFEVKTTNITWEDKTRITAARDGYDEKASRILKATIWYPDKLREGHHPLLVYSHGLSSYRQEGTYVGRHMARKGYIVVSADYPLTNIRTPGGATIKDVINQPADINYIINSMLMMSNDESDVFYNSIDSERIGLVGLSLGGLTTEIAVYDRHIKDNRIKAAVSIAGPTYFFSKKYFEGLDIPFLMIAADKDALVNYDLNARPILEKIPGSILVTIAAWSHTGFGYGTAMMRWINNPDSIGCYIITRNLSGVGENWLYVLGSPEDGISYDIDTSYCQQNPLPKALNPIRQHTLTTLAVSSFFESHFNNNLEIRNLNKKYLLEKMPEELKEVSVKY